MKFRQEFDVSEPVAKVWLFFDQPDRVATCIPGVEDVQVVDADTLIVRATQKVGPIGATFESKVHITERLREERIRFTSTGKAVRGAVGNFRATNTVYLEPVGDRARVVVEGEAALAGMLGSVGQKVIMKQAEKVTAEFARNLEQALSGRAPPTAPPLPAAVPPAAPDRGAFPQKVLSPALAVGPVPDPWAKAAAILSGLSALIGLLVLWQLGARP